MTKKRVFVALNLPERVKDQLEKTVEAVREKVDPSIRFTDRETWHLTLVFLGEQTDDEILDINDALAEAAEHFEIPEVKFEKVVYGPVGRTPRMIWLVADKESSRKLGVIKAFLEAALAGRNIRFDQEHRQFVAHITLARFTALHREGLPELEVPFAHSYESKTLDLMQSHLRSSGSEYEPLSQFDFEGEEQ